jgi:hypothetical protein
VSKSITTLQTAVVSAISLIVISSLTVTTDVYAQNTTNTNTVQQKVADITNATNPTTWRAMLTAFSSNDLFIRRLDTS